MDYGMEDPFGSVTPWVVGWIHFRSKILVPDCLVSRLRPGRRGKRSPRMSPKTKTRRAARRNLVLVLGDQLDERSAAFDGFDPRTDAVWMAEVAHESEKVWVAKPRVAIFLAAMRHFRDMLRARGWRVYYRTLTEGGAKWSAPTGDGADETFGTQLAWTLAQTRPARLIVVEPGE